MRQVGPCLERDPALHAWGWVFSTRGQWGKIDNAAASVDVKRGGEWDTSYWPASWYEERGRRLPQMTLPIAGWCRRGFQRGPVLH